MLLIFFVLALAGCAETGSGTHAGDDPWIADVVQRYPELEGKSYSVDEVKRVVDGDTFETASGDKVRLIGVNTPEVHGKTEYFGREASEFSKERLGGKAVVMFKDVSETDRYGRLLRYVFVKNDPVMFNEALVAQGYANASTYPPDVMFAERFAELEREARESDKGLWKRPEAQTGASTTARTSAVTPPACENPQIKGNINSRGEKIYHVPGGRNYEQTKPEMMFCTETDAEAAGFREPKR